jgi:hypothetical protein
MSLMGSGRVKTPTPAARVETSWRKGQNQQSSERANVFRFAPNVLQNSTPTSERAIIDTFPPKAEVEPPSCYVAEVPFPDFADDAVKDAPWLQVDTRFSRAAGGAFPSSLPKVRIDRTTGETWNSCFMRLTRQ